jgi:outer membrane protein assembly factor BamB
MHVVDIDSGQGIRRIPLDAPSGATPLLMGELAYVGTEGNEFLAVDWKKDEFAWRFSMEQAVRSSAVHKEGCIIVCGMDKTVYALDADTGVERWKYKTKGRIEGGAVIVGNRVYVPSTDSSLHVLDFQSGRKLGSIKLSGKLLTSPAVADNHMLIVTDEGTLTCLMMLNSEDD